jgi:hypothetical protein
MARQFGARLSNWAARQQIKQGHVRREQQAPGEPGADQLVFAAPHASAPQAPQTFSAPQAPHAAAPQAPHALAPQAPHVLTFSVPQAAHEATLGVVDAIAAARPPLTTIMASAFFDLMFMKFSSGCRRRSFRSAAT